MAGEAGELSMQKLSLVKKSWNHILIEWGFGAWQSLSYGLDLLLPLKNGGCRFYPTCSHYARQAIKRYGMIHGVWLSMKRILRCHPGNLGGYDPVK